MLGFIGDLLYSLLESFSGENPLIAGGVVLGAVALIVTPFVQRWVSRRKRVLYRVQADSKIGLDVDLDGDQSVYNDPDLAHMSNMFKRLSSVVIRIRNTGGDVSVGDLGEPVKFTFNGRVIWNARISDPSHRVNEEDRAKLVDGLEFFSTDPASSAAEQPIPLVEVRRTLASRLKEALRVAPAGLAPAVEPESPPPVWHGIRLKPSLALKARERFKLIVVLSEPEGTRAVAKGVTGPNDHKHLKNERNLRRARWPWVTAAFGVLLTGLWLAAVVVFPVNQAGTAVDCAEGSLKIVGSTAFAPTMTDVAQEYSAACDAQITVAANGSSNGVREVARAQPGEQIAAMSDGRSTEATPEMRARPVAVIVYTMIVNKAVGIDELTVEQVRDLYAGRYQDWNQLRPGPSMPIRLVGRGGESGSRRTFEQTMLSGASQGELTSDSCETADHILGAPVIRCERPSEDEVIDEVAVTPGTIGYVSLASADRATRDDLPVTVQKLGGQYPDVSSAAAGYPFWTIEYLYTKESPGTGTLLESLLRYLRTKTVYAELVEAGYTPCVTTDGQTYLLCQEK